MAIIILDWLVARAGSAARILGGPDGTRAAWVAIAASVGVLAATAVSVVLVLRTSEGLAPVALDPPPEVTVIDTPPVQTPGRGASPATSPAPTRAGTTRQAPPTQSSAVPAPSAPTAAPPAPPALTAAFAVTDSALLSYGAAVTIGNPGRAPASTWTLVITLPRESLDITAVEGARVSRNGATWTFVPDGPGGRVPGQGAVQVSFRVDGSSLSSLPTACTIDDEACTGLPD